MIGGYILVDCGGLELTSQTKQTIDGIYERVKIAYDTGKPVYATNVLFDEKPMTPVAVMVNPLPGDEDILVCTASTLQIRVDEDDGVTIVNMLAA